MDNPYNNYQSYDQQAQSYDQQYQNSDSFGWDDVITEESSFTLLPEGNYRFAIKKFEKGRYNGGDKISACPRATVTFTVYNPDGTTSELTENFLLHKKMEWRLSEFFASVGLKKKGEPVRMLWTPELIGKQGICKVVVHTYQKNGEDKQSNRIDKLYPSYDAPTLSAPTQPAQSGGWTQGKF